MYTPMAHDFAPVAHDYAPVAHVTRSCGAPTVAETSIISIVGGGF